MIKCTREIWGQVLVKDKQEEAGTGKGSLQIKMHVRHLWMGREGRLGRKKLQLQGSSRKLWPSCWEVPHLVTVEGSCNTQEWASTVTFSHWPEQLIVQMPRGSRRSAAGAVGRAPCSRKSECPMFMPLAGVESNSLFEYQLDHLIMGKLVWAPNSSSVKWRY